jgi:hypothetical protein
LPLLLLDIIGGQRLLGYRVLVSVLLVRILSTHSQLDLVRVDLALLINESGEVQLVLVVESVEERVSNHHLPYPRAHHASLEKHETLLVVYPVDLQLLYRPHLERVTARHPPSLPHPSRVLSVPNRPYLSESLVRSVRRALALKPVPLDDAHEALALGLSSHVNKLPNCEVPHAHHGAHRQQVGRVNLELLHVLLRRNVVLQILANRRSLNSVQILLARAQNHRVVSKVLFLLYPYHLAPVDVQNSQRNKLGPLVVDTRHPHFLRYNS